ncbi:Hypothetical_protein [Hexamita inflata]|uniref:Hypothetical_protein n=2 Tax=Hexamita inflata TaxID=28002 RepID=A0ABP1J9W7_9EUKA
MLSCKIFLSVNLASVYNNLTTDAIINDMELQRVPRQIQLLIIGMIQAQNSIETHSHSISQELICSTLIFSYCMNPVILELKQQFACVNFADDTIVELKPLDTQKMALEFLDKLFGKQYLPNQIWNACQHKKMQTNSQRSHRIQSSCLIYNIKSKSNILRLNFEHKQNQRIL